jgi:hypothetical protein
LTAHRYFKAIWSILWSFGCTYISRFGVFPYLIYICFPMP